MKEKKLYLLRDVTLGGFLTWMEKKENAILMFTRGQLAERYITEVYPERRIVVFILNRRVVKQFVAEMIASNINYAIIDLPPEHVDPYASDEQVRNYGILNLLGLFGKYF